MMKPKTWALVSNGVRARVLRGLETGRSDGPRELIFRSSSRHLQHVLADRTGRGLASESDGPQSALEPEGDPILRDMHEFAQEVLCVLALRLRHGEYRQLALIASPRMLGVLSAELPPDLRSVVVLERALNLVGLSETKLRQSVRDLLVEEHLA